MNSLTLFKGKTEKDRRSQKKNPWFLETVQNGLKATNVKETSTGIRPTKTEVQYFEFDRIFGQGAFDVPLRMPEMFDELKEITPKTKGFIFGPHKYLYHRGGILRVRHDNGRESFFSDETLKNESVACYLNLVYSQEEDIIKSFIDELEYATDRPNQESDSRARISH